MSILAIGAAYHNEFYEKSQRRFYAESEPNGNVFGGLDFSTKFCEDAFFPYFEFQPNDSLWKP